MTTAPESHRVTNDQPVQPGSGAPGAIARAAMARAQWVQRALSPWVQRWLPTVASPETGTDNRLGRHTQIALTGTHMSRLLDRVQRVVDRTTVWRADVGSVEPTMVDRFASKIADRFSMTSARYEPQPLAVSPAETTDLVLAGTPVKPDLGGDVSLEFEAGDGEPTPRPTMAQLREILATRPSSRTSPPVPGQPSPPQVQRVAAEPPRPRPPARTVPARARLFSRVEELPPSGRTRIGRISGSEVRRVPEEEVASQAPSGRTRIGRISGSEVRRGPEEEMVSQVPSGRTRIGRIGGSEVRQQLDEEPLPAKRTRIGRINGSEVRRVPEEEVASQAPSGRTRIDRINGSEVRRLPEEEVASQAPSGRTRIGRIGGSEVRQQLDEEPLPAKRTRIGRINGSEVRRGPEEEMGSQASSLPEAPPSEGTRIGRIGGSEVRQQLDEEPLPSKRTRIDRINGSEVRRVPEEEMASQASSLPEAPPSEGTRIGRIGGSEVQRQLEERPPPGPEMPAPPLAKPEPPRPPIVSREVTPGQPEAPPPARAEPPMEPGQPAGQPQPTLSPSTLLGASADAPSAVEGPALSAVEGVQRKVELGERAAGLEEEVLARAALSARLPLTEPLRPASGLARARPPARTAILPRAQAQARLADGRGQARLADGRGQARLADERGQARLADERVQARFADGRVQARFADERVQARLADGRVQARLADGRVQARLADGRVQARFADEGMVMPVSKPVPARAEPVRTGPARPPAWRGEYPLPPVSRPAPAALIQRQPAAPPVELAVAAQGADVVQRVVETPPETGLTTEEEEPELDLDHLARQVYPLIKRMLAVERERRSAR